MGVSQNDLDYEADHVSTGRGLRAWIVSGPAVEGGVFRRRHLFKIV